MRRDIAAEIGDCLWYCAVLANDLRFDLARSQTAIFKNSQTASSGVFCTEAVTSGKVSSITASFLAPRQVLLLTAGGFVWG